MKKHSLILLFALITGPASFAQTNYPLKLEEHLQAQVGVKQFNGNVLVAKKGQILYQKAFGYANYVTKTLLTLNSMFELASVSKQFTAMSILLLKEQGKLSLADSLRKFFPELPYNGITIRHLLTHTSGVPDYMGLMSSGWDPNKVAFNADMIRLLALKKPPLLFRPGQKWAYSNTGYVLLASIVEKASGQSFAEFTSRYIFKPLGMKRSRIYNTRRSTTEIIPDYAYGYVYSDSLSRYVLPDSIPAIRFIYYLDGIQGDGMVNSTVSDLLKWDRALKNHTLLPEATQQEMLSGQVLVDSVRKAYSYGYGVGVGKRDNRDFISHSGGWAGYSTLVARYLANDLTIVVLSNNNSNVQEIANNLADIMVDKAVQLPKKLATITVDEWILDQYVGVYEGSFGSNPKATFTITREGNQLFEELTGGEKLKIFPQTKTLFVLAQMNAQLEFIHDASGKVSKRILTANGQRSEAKKIN